MKLSSSILVCFVILIFSGCNQDYTPKPRGYVRIDLPEKSYQPIESECPYRFEFATYAEFIPDMRSQSDPCWFDIYYPQFKAKVHFSYKRVDGNLMEYLEDSRALTNKHISKASGIDEALILKEDSRVFGTIYSIDGSQTASPLQFHLTDSTEHFLRGALYFNVSPNNDSLAPVIDFLKQDMLHLIETLNWKP
ncbi:gliding motility lipoprotein GldD [Flavobacteriales bacterium]|nr:gliding motility lipoprotein GldD [Flavobacteriales bacterium]